MGGLGYGGTPLAYLIDLAAGKRVHDDSSAAVAVVPVDSVECSLTDDAVLALPDDLREAVTAWHCASSGTMDEVARRLGVVKTTLWRRLCHADMRIQEWFRDRRSAAQ